MVVGRIAALSYSPFALTATKVASQRIGSRSESHLMTDTIELVLTVRVELPDELVALLRQLARASTAPTRAARPRGHADKTWTQERKDALRQLWRCGQPIGEVRKSLERLPGAKLPSNMAIAAYAGYLRVSRPPGFRRVSGRPVVNRGLARPPKSPGRNERNQPVSHRLFVDTSPASGAA